VTTIRSCLTTNYCMSTYRELYESVPPNLTDNLGKCRRQWWRVCGGKLSTIKCGRCKKKLHVFDQTFEYRNKIYHLECAAKRGLLHKWKWWKNPI